MSKIPFADQVVLIEDFLNENFEFRRNEVRDIIEYKVISPELGGGLVNTEFEPLTEDAENSIILETIKSGFESNVADIVKRIIRSKSTKSFNPLQGYLKNLPAWDGKDRVTELIYRIPGMTDEIADFLHIWLRGVVAHWLGKDKYYGNQLVPMFIGDQGCQKGSFIKYLMPDELQVYYLDHINLVNKHDTDMALANCGLVNIDEFDRYTPSQQGTLKYIITKADVNARKIYGRSIVLRDRMASFIGTTNVVRPYKDKTGTRRFVTVLIPFGEIIPKLPIEYDQLYAQLVNEVCEQNLTYWLTPEQNKRLQVLNNDFCEEDDFTAMLGTCVRKPENGEQSEGMTSTQILTLVQKKYPEVKINRKSQSLLGVNLSAMGITSHRTNKGNLYDVVEIAA